MEGVGVAYGARTRNLWSHKLAVTTRKAVREPSDVDAHVDA
jgi:hypothetical protein